MLAVQVDVAEYTFFDDHQTRVCEPWLITPGWSGPLSSQRHGNRTFN